MHTYVYMYLNFIGSQDAVFLIDATTDDDMVTTMARCSIILCAN